MAQFFDPVNKPPEASSQQQLQWQDPRLGRMYYCDEDETWLGWYNGFEFRIAFDGAAQPDEYLLGFCYEVLSAPEALEQTLKEQKQLKLGCHGGCFDDEIGLLVYLNLMFYRCGSSLRVLAQLSPSIPKRGNLPDVVQDTDDERLWRLEFYDGVCQGLDFEY